MVAGVSRHPMIGSAIVPSVHGMSWLILNKEADNGVHDGIGKKANHQTIEGIFEGVVSFVNLFLIAVGGHIDEGSCDEHHYAEGANEADENVGGVLDHYRDFR